MATSQLYQGLSIKLMHANTRALLAHVAAGKEASLPLALVRLRASPTLAQGHCSVIVMGLLFLLWPSPLNAAWLS